VGYYCAGMNKLAAVQVRGNAGTGVAENLMSGSVVVDGNASQAAGATGPAVVVKRGERGALCGSWVERWQVSLPPVAPVDATGAGDCFNAGLIAGLLDGLALPRAAALGCAAGALSTQAAGGTAGAPDRAAAAARAQLVSVS